MKKNFFILIFFIGYLEAMDNLTWIYEFPDAEKVEDATLLPFLSDFTVPSQTPVSIQNDSMLSPIATGPLQNKSNQTITPSPQSTNCFNDTILKKTHILTVNKLIINKTSNKKVASQTKPKRKYKKPTKTMPTRKLQVCHYCAKQFYKQTLFDEHIFNHKHESIFNCPNCHESFRDQRMLWAHQLLKICCKDDSGTNQ